MLQAMLGLYPYAPLHLLIVDPHLPGWLPEISLRGLRVGNARLDLREYARRPGEVVLARDVLDYALQVQEAFARVAEFGSRLELDGQLAARFLERFRAVEAPERLVVAPEARDGAEAPKKKRGFWGRLFGRGDREPEVDARKK